MDTIPHKAMMRVSEACADDATVLALSVVRMVAAGYSTGDVACWDLAYARAERLLDPEAAGRFVGSLIALVRSVRAARVADWCFLPASCCRVTGDECCLMRLLTAAREGEYATVARLVDDVVGAAPSRQVQTAAFFAATVLDDVSRAMPMTVRTASAPPAALH